MKILLQLLMSLTAFVFSFDNTDNSSSSQEVQTQTDAPALPQVLLGLGNKKLQLRESTYSKDCPRGQVNVLFSGERNGKPSYNLHFYDETRNGFFFGNQFYIQVAEDSTSEHLVTKKPDQPALNCSIKVDSHYTLSSDTLVGDKMIRQNCNGEEEKTKESYKLIKNEDGEFTISYVRQKKHFQDSIWKMDIECNYTTTQQ